MTALRLALVGAPNSGKSTLFNGLTGGRAKVANYPGVTVERRIGHFATPDGRNIELIDLPGIYGLSARSRDAEIAIHALVGQMAGEEPPDAMLVLVEAAILRTHLHSVLELKSLGRPMVLALNMIDLAERDGVKIDIDALEKRLGIPVVACRATRSAGRAALLARLDKELRRIQPGTAKTLAIPAPDLKALQREARAIAKDVIVAEPPLNKLTRAVDSVVLNPLAGPLILAGLLFLVFQAVYAWSALPMDAIDSGFSALQGWVKSDLPQNWFSSLIADGVIAGVGSVIVFLPQIIILFAFILLLEASGYMSRAAFLTDELMSRVGLNGRSVIPLLSSFACAIPGIMSTRAIEGERDRMTTILIAPLMTCSARLPVYALIIGAFIPRQSVGPFNLQGLVLFALYLAGIVSAIGVAYVLRKTVTKGKAQPLLMELPSYKVPDLKTFLLDLWHRVGAFLKRAGTIILGVAIALWFLASYPATDEGVRGSFAGMIGRVLEPILAPIGFNLQIAIALVPGMAAREVAVAALGTVYSLQGSDDQVTHSLASVLQSAWSLPTALAFLAWYVFAPQCLSTLVVARREMNSWKWTAFMFGYLFALAYIAAGVTYWIATALTA
jgi:ferrous iron transport protein B